MDISLQLLFFDYEAHILGWKHYLSTEYRYTWLSGMLNVHS